jgi:hypothetical protein
MNGHVDDELPALLGGELPPSVAAAHAHLAGCDRCRLELAPGPLELSAGQRIGPAAVVVAATGDGLDPAYQATRQAAVAIAARDGARLVLFDRSPELYLVDPYERARGNGGGPRGSSLLGLEGAAWVARGHGPDALAAACEVLEAERVVLPAAPDGTLAEAF